MTHAKHPTIVRGVSVPGEGVVTLGETGAAVYVLVELVAGARAAIYLPPALALAIADQVRQSARRVLAQDRRP